MLLFLRYFVFAITSLLVLTFTCYLHFTYFFDTYWHWFNNDIKDFEEYDYVVVGAGSAGATLSASLADNGYKVLLLEAGGTAPPFLDIPLLAPVIQRTPYDWQYVTVPQIDACRSLINRESRWPMGKIIGGTGRLNYMLYVRGHPTDYDKWFPSFIDPVAWDNAPMTVNDLKWTTDLADIILAGVKEMRQHVRNVNENLTTGFMKPQMFTENGQRWSTDKLLYQNPKRKLTIILHARVDKVLIESKKAVGVQFVTFDRTFKAVAKKGVILSAGTIGSPKILMLSGIGPKKHLKDVKIEVIKDLPVGQHLADHILTGIDLVKVNTTFGLNIADALNPMSALQYFLFGEGPWTSAGVDVLGTFHSSLEKNESTIPNLQLMVLPLGLSKDNGIVLKEGMGILDEVYNKYFAPLVHENTITIAPVLLHPKSTGEVKLRSNNPLDPPLIDPKYLSNKEDISTLIAGLEFVSKLIETNAMKAIGSSIHRKNFPGCEKEVFGSSEYWKCYVQHLTLTSYHPAGTCRMGDVVDTSFRVRDIVNLYVVDASVLPSLPSGNINAAVIMLAQRAARMFRRDAAIDVNTRKCYKLYNYCDIFRVCGGT